MRPLFMTVLLALIPAASFAQHSTLATTISIEFQHSRRIPYNHILVELYPEASEFFLEYKTDQMAGHTGYEDSNTTGKLEVSRSQFDLILKEFFDLNLSELARRNQSLGGRDGETWKVSVGNHANAVTLNLWSPRFDQEKRGTSGLLRWLDRVLDICNLRNKT